MNFEEDMAFVWFVEAQFEEEANYEALVRKMVEGGNCW